MKNIILLFVLTLFSCAEDNTIVENDPLENKVLMLQVDYTTNRFLGGKEYVFNETTPSFSIVSEYRQPNDFGSIKMIYSELNEPLFFGGIHWMGLGQISIPNEISSPNFFEVTTALDVIAPQQGFENLTPDNQATDLVFWNSLQHLVKVREYLQQNRRDTVKYFLYTPSVGVGNPEDWSWIVFIKN